MFHKLCVRMHLVLLYYYLVFTKNKLYEYLSNQTMTHLQAALEKKKRSLHFEWSDCMISKWAPFSFTLHFLFL